MWLVCAIEQSKTDMSKQDKSTSRISGIHSVLCVDSGIAGHNQSLINTSLQRGGLRVTYDRFNGLPQSTEGNC
jgi:hypothetical protein